ncbi:MAG TPA: ABC transporter ATP-binding protein [Steroidobacteraceae bacterium]|nr:ABC transporter ATP-binding protein [Steroidobacteraceae bacterium]
MITLEASSLPMLPASGPPAHSPADALLAGEPRESAASAAEPRVAQASAPILEVRSLVKHYPAVTAVDGVSFEVREGICFGLLGPNGAGKTTTIEIMEGILTATAGEVRYRGAPLGARFREEAGILFQKTALQDFLTVRQSLALFRGLYGRGLDVDEVIRICALEKLARRDNRKLSGGQQQRLLLAIALVNDPALLFLDEPTTGLDPQARRNFWELIQSIKARNKTVILTTHYMEEAELLCDEIAIMDRGRIIARGAPRQLLREHFAEVLLELPRQDFPESARHLPLRVLDTPERVEITTDDLDATLRILIEARVPLSNLRIRPANLEDLFLELTGKELRA